MSQFFNLVNKTFQRNAKEEEEEETEDPLDDTLSFNEFERLSGGGRDDDLFGVSEDFANGISRSESEMDSDVDSPLYRTKVNWDINLAYSLTYANTIGQRDFTNNSLMVSGDFDVNGKWKIGMSSGYDFKNKGVTYTQLRFNRDLDSWQLNFNWVPFSIRTSWYFFIGIKSGLLSDLKYEKRREPDRSFNR